MSRTRLAVCEVGGEVIDGEGSRFVSGPFLRDGPEQGGRGCNFLREGLALGVPHDALASVFAAAGELATGDERRLGRSGIAAARGHKIGKVDPGGLHAD